MSEDALMAAQLNGTACIKCGRDFLTDATPSEPAADQPKIGPQLFVCANGSCIRRTGPTIDSTQGYKYTPAPEHVQRTMRRRFEDAGITAIDPDDPTCYRHGVDNWWDGAYTVLNNGDGSYTYRNPYNGDEDRFDEHGSWWSDGLHHPWTMGD